MKWSLEGRPGDREGSQIESLTFVYSDPLPLVRDGECSIH